MPVKKSAVKSKPAAKAAAKPAAKAAAKPAAKPAAKAPAAKTPARARPASASMSLAEVMAALEKAGSAQTKKTYLRHGAKEPLFGVQFATLKDLWKKHPDEPRPRVRAVGHGQFRRAQPRGEARRSRANDACAPRRWARCNDVRDVRELRRGARERGAARPRAGGGVAAASRRHPARDRLVARRRARHARRGDARRAGFSDASREIERTIASAPNAERGAMNPALIALGCRNAAMRKAVERRGEADRPRRGRPRRHGVPDARRRGVRRQGVEALDVEGLREPRRARAQPRVDASALLSHARRGATRRAGPRRAPAHFARRTAFRLASARRTTRSHITSQSEWVDSSARA